MTVLGIFVLDHFAIFMLENFLLYRHVRAVGRDMRPAVAPMANEQSELCGQRPGARLGDLDLEIMLDLGRAHRVSHDFSKLAPPFCLFHNQIPQLTRRPNVIPSDKLCNLRSWFDWAHHEREQGIPNQLLPFALSSVEGLLSSFHTVH